jgi:hypothetical protein
MTIVCRRRILEVDVRDADALAPSIIAYLDAGRVVSVHRWRSRWDSLQLRDPFLQSWHVFYSDARLTAC